MCTSSREKNNTCGKLCQSKFIYDVYYKFADYVNQRIEERHSIGFSGQVISTFSGADELMKYKNLLDSGLITKEEYERKKRQILG
ncbi:MAG: SHOCT domain-containing protein [Oscillospiraceae bacterium]|nr:SHOCT domain-containing protein [Oscillospiraceae bacterium]